MTEHSLETSTPKKLQTSSVADYIVQRIADEGVTHCFGVAGDYLFPMCNAIESSQKVKWIGCANELNAAYAADGYARIRGAGMLATTYGVGELSALNGVMGAKAERSLVFHVVGMPSYQNQRLSKIAHHTLGDGQFGNFAGLSAAATCCSALINPDNCVIEMERVIAEARRNNQPAYILVPSDHALAPVSPVDVRPLTLKSNEAALKKAVVAISERLKGAKSVVVLPAFTIARLGLQNQLRDAIEALGCPFATMVMEKCLVDESHPQYAGLYAGAMSAQSAREIVEGADVVIDLGGVNLNDITTAAYSARLDPARFITVGLNDVRVGEKVISGVRLQDMLVELAKLKSPAPPFRRTVESARRPSPASHRIGLRWMRSIHATPPLSGLEIRSFLKRAVLRLASCPCGLPMECGLRRRSCGDRSAGRRLRPLALRSPIRADAQFSLPGEGSHQLTANEIGSMGRFAANIIVFVLNNEGYLIERALEENPDWSYNDLAPWRYAELPRALGCADWFAARVTTLGELDAAMKAARESKSGAYIEVVGERMDMPPILAFAHDRLATMYGDAP